MDICTKYLKPILRYFLPYVTKLKLSYSRFHLFYKLWQLAQLPPTGDADKEHT